MENEKIRLMTEQIEADVREAALEIDWHRQLRPHGDFGPVVYDKHFRDWLNLADVMRICSVNETEAFEFLHLFD